MATPSLKASLALTGKGNTCLITATVYSVSDATGWLYLNFNHLLDIIPDADILT